MATIGFEIDSIVSTPITHLTDLAEVSTQKLIEGAKDVILELKKQGHKIVFYTRRDVSTALATESWLDKNKIPYDQITFNRPHTTTIFFSENSRRFTTWDNVVSELRAIGVYKDPILPTDNNDSLNQVENTTGGVQKLKNDI